jgi:hypothetical protein
MRGGAGAQPWPPVHWTGHDETESRNGGAAGGRLAANRAAIGFACPAHECPLKLQNIIFIGIKFDHGPACVHFATGA